MRVGPLHAALAGALFLALAGLIDAVDNDDFYTLLGVDRDASTRDIRKGFKKVALIRHPDKNRDDPEAHNKFLRINRAYEVLKDESLRKIYNEKGEKGLEKEDGPSGNNYQNWNFYKNEFGIYDEDVEIVTLSKADFLTLVSNTNEVWFINFYSPRCSHCHTLAPTWREVGREMEGVIRIGAVNCMDEWMLCNQQGINSYPSIMEYPKNKKYKGDKSRDSLISYMLRVADITLHELNDNGGDLYDNIDRMLVTFCGQGECLSKISSLKLTSIFKGLITVSTINCDIYESLCLRYGYTQGTVYFPQGPRSPPLLISSLDVKEISETLLKQLPDVEFVSETDLEELMANENAQHHLLHFVDGLAYDHQFKKLPSLLGEDIKFGVVDCAQTSHFCEHYYALKRPSFALVRRQGLGIDFHYGRPIVGDVVSFASNSGATPCRTLSPLDFPVDSSEDMWFIDFFAPWCPPCMKLLPEFRKASAEVDDVNFGVVDCTIHEQICREYGISSYPTTIVFNASKAIHYNGEHTVQAIVEYVADIRNPPVAILDDASFEDIVMSRSDSHVVVVDFFAPWCGPCQQLAPAWRQLAKLYKINPDIVVASVDCTQFSALCQKQGVGSYPTIKAYHMGSNNKYSNWERDVYSLRNWVKDFLPQIVRRLTPTTFQQDVIDAKTQTFWLIDFFSPWCGPCKRFAPKLKDRVNCASVDCQKYGHLCQSSGIHSYPSVRLFISDNDHQGITIDHSDVEALIKTVRIKVGEKRKVIIFNK